MLATTFVLLSFGLAQPVAAPALLQPGITASVAPAGEQADAVRLVQHRRDGRHHRRGDDRRGRDGIDRGSLDADRYLYDFRDAPRWRAEERARHDGRGRDGRRDDGRRDGDGRHRDRDHRDGDDRHRADHRDRDEDRRDRGSDGDWDYGRGFDNDRTRDDQRGDSRFRERRERFEERRKRW